MTVKQLLNLSVEELEAMDDATLRAHCEPFLRIVSLDPNDTEDEIAEDGSRIVSLGEVKPKKKQISAEKKSLASMMMMQEMMKAFEKAGVDPAKMATLKLPTGLK